MRGHRDLRLIGALALACGLLAVALPVDVLSLLFAVPLTLFLPGYAIALATFARRPIKRVKLLVLGLGLSLAVLALGALVLNYLPGGIRAGSWALLLVLVVLGACRAAAIRRPRARAGGRSPASGWPGLPAVLTLAAAVLTVTGALVLTFTTLPAKHAIGYTALWIKPLGSSAQGGARSGVGSNEQHRLGYLLHLRFGNGAPQVRRFGLNPGEERVIHFAAATSNRNSQPVTAVLYRADEPQRAYRRVSAWLPPPRGLR